MKSGFVGGRLLFALLALCLLLRMLLASRAVSSLDGVTIPDDCYYSLNVARSIAAGKGPLYGPLHTNGFQPLFVFLMVPAFWVSSDLLLAVREALVLCGLADTLALYFLTRILRDRGVDARAIGVVMVMWAVSPYCLSNGVNGLETSLAVCLLLAAVWKFAPLVKPASTPRDFFVFGIAAGLALFARVDAAILLAVAGCLALRPLLSRGAATLARSAVSTVAGVVLVNASWWVYSFRYTGRIYPISGRAVRYISQADVHHHPTLQNFYIPELRTGVREVLVDNAPTLALLVIAIIGIAVTRGRPGLRAYVDRALESPLLPLHSAAVFGAYALYIFTEWFFFRYFYPLNAAFLLLLGIALSELFTVLGEERMRRMAVTIAAAIGVLGNVARPAFREIFTTDDGRDLAALNIGEWADKNLAPGTIVGCPSSGALGYFAPRLTVVNLDGVVNHEAYAAMTRGELFQYARSAGVDHILLWGPTMNLLRNESQPWAPGELEDLGVIPGFRTYRKPWHWYRIRRPS